MFVPHNTGCDSGGALHQTIIYRSKLYGVGARHCRLDCDVDMDIFVHTLTGENVSSAEIMYQAQKKNWEALGDLRRLMDMMHKIE